MKSTPNKALELGEKLNPCLEKNIQDEENDLVFLDQLSTRFKGRSFLMVEMSKIFLDQAPVMRKILENSSDMENHEEIRFEAHKFKSTVNIIGLDSLRSLASKTEEIYYDGKPKFDTTELLLEFANQISIDMKRVENVIKIIASSKSEN